MATELALSLGDQMTLATKLATSNLLPQSMRNRPENLLYALQYAQALQVHPMTAITGIHVIEGKPSASADLIAGMVRRAGHKLRVRATDTTATAEIIRADDPTYTFTATWTLERAKTAGLTGKGPWKAYPAAMLKARAITEVARLACSECLFGVIYTPEELGANVTEDGDVVDVAPPAAVVPVRDWLGEAKACQTIDDLRRLWKECEKEGALAAVRAEFTTIADKLKTPPPVADAPFFDDDNAPEVG